MEWPDYIIFAILGLSVLMGFFRGFLRETMSLAIWAVAFWVAFTFTENVVPLLANGIELPSARTAIAFAMLFLAALILGGLLSWIIGHLVEKTGLSGTDRMLGGIFGVLRGLALVVLLLLLAGFTPLSKDPWFQQSKMVQKILPLAEWSTGFIPESLRSHIGFSADKETLPAYDLLDATKDQLQRLPEEGSDNNKT
ncbi:MAG: CvpA family protein [Xanthomonadales bacterium]|nr:CvpA family protein [Xanthomonadales bacterium]